MIVTLFNPLSNLEVRGVSKVTDELARHLRKAGHTVHEVKIPVYLWKESSLIRNLLVLLFQQFATLLVAIKTRSDIVIDPYNGYSILGTLLFKTKYFVHDYIPFYRSGWFLRPGTLFKYMLYKIDALFRLAETYHVAFDTDTPPYLKKGIQPRVFPLLMDPLDRSRSTFFEETIVPMIKSRSYVLISTISGKTWNKDFEGLVALLRLLQCEVVIVAFGFGDQEFSYTESKTNTGERCEIFQVGFVEEAAIAETISRSKVFVFHSLREGFGRPVVEALQLRKQVVTRSVPVLSLLSDEAMQNIVVYDGTSDFVQAIQLSLNKRFTDYSKIYRLGVDSNIDEFLK